MTQKKTMTKNEAREWLDGKSTKTCTFRQISEVRSFAKQLGFKVLEYKQRAVMRVRFCTLSMELKEMYWATPDKYSLGYIELSDLLAIEIVEEPDHRALLEEAVKLLEEAKSRVWYWQALYQKKNDDPLIGKIEQFLKANRP